MKSTPTGLPRVCRTVAGYFVVGLTIFVPGCARESLDSSPVKEPAADRTPAAGAPESSQQPAVTLPATSARFVDRADESGVDFVYRNDEESGHFAILESLGGGVAIIDFDTDGRPDLFVPGGGAFNGQLIKGRPGELFRNVGQWTFLPVAANAGATAAPHYSHGAAAADYDHDGFIDLLVTGYGGLTLFRNEGDGTFSEVAAAAGLDDTLWSSSAAWGDLTGDGNLDLYVAHYVNWSFANDPYCGTPARQDVCPPKQFDPLPDVLYVSNGDGTFRDASREAGLRTDGKGLGVIMADVDLDGHLDVYVANDTVENFLYRNDGSGRLEDRSLMSGTSLNQAGLPDGSMGVDLGDYNLDGLPDLWVANYEHESFALYRNLGNCLFLHASQTTGVTSVGSLFVGWGTAFFDFDNDGREDVFASNGHVIRYPSNAPLRQVPLLFEIDGDRFRNVAPAAGDYMASPHMGRGVAVGDLDGDGRLDLVVSHTNEPVAVLKNESANTGDWIALHLVGTRSSRLPVGATVTLHTGTGRQTRQQKGGGSYASTSDPRIHFGLGEAAVERVEIRWPSGLVQTLHDVPSGVTTTVIEGRGSIGQ